MFTFAACVLPRADLPVQESTSEEVELTWFGGEEIDEMYPAGASIYWLEYHGSWDPSLHGLDSSTGARTAYAAPLSYDTLNLRVSPEAVGFAEVQGSKIVYHVYEAGQPDTELTRLEQPQWWAYALDGADLYLVVTATPQDPGTKLLRVAPGGEPELVTTLEEAGATIGEFWDFFVEGQTMIFLESGRIWRLDLGSLRAEWLGNEQQVTGTVHVAPDGVLFTTDRPWFFELQTGELLDVASLIASAPGEGHHYEQDITRWGDRFVYVGTRGVFALDPERVEVAPILLDTHVDYRYPVVLEDGQMFVTALDGADGPVYQLDLASLELW